MATVMSGLSSTQQVNVVVDASDCERENASVPADTGHVAPEPYFFGDELLSFFGAEDDMEVMFGEGVGHVLCRPYGAQSFIELSQRSGCARLARLPSRWANFFRASGAVATRVRTYWTP